MLHDEMLLTDVRTGLGGAIASRTLARKNSNQVLVIGTGPQARRQIEAHSALQTDELSFQVWGRDANKAKKLIADMEAFADVTLADDLVKAVENTDIIVTATGSTSAYLQSEWVNPGTHITAVGADAPGKQELDVGLVARADVLVTDLTSQCLDHGELSHAAMANVIDKNDVRELGAVLDEPSLGRRSEQDLTIVDLTGIAAQDIAITNSVMETWRARRDFD